jgi:NOL1/NOP2/fmu family ribosome biogenesis protein
VLARIGLHLAPINKDIAQFQHTQMVCNQQDLHKQLFQLRQKPLAETVNAVVIRVQTARNINEGHRFIARLLQFATGKYPRGITVK